MWTRSLKLLRGTALVLTLSSCVVHDTRPVNSGYGYRYGGGAGARITVGPPPPYVVSSMPPDPLYEQMSVSPGSGQVWIDGSWHWNGFEWVWLGGRWQRTQGSGLVYIQPHYTYSEGRYIYTPGYWSRRERVPSGWAVRDRRDGRPPFAAPPPGYRPPPPPIPPAPRYHSAPP